MAAEPGDNAFDAAIPWYQILADRIALLQCHAPSISAEDFLKHKFWAGNTNFFARLFAYPCSKKSKKYACDRLQKEKLIIQQIKLFLHFPVINYDHIYKAMDL